MEDEGSLTWCYWIWRAERAEGVERGVRIIQARGLGWRRFGVRIARWLGGCGDGDFFFGEGFFRSRYRRERAHLKDGRYVTVPAAGWLRHGGIHGSFGGVELGCAAVREPDHG